MKNRYPEDKCPQNIHAIHQTEIYPLDSITYPLRNQVWMGKYLAQANIFYYTIQPNLACLTSSSFIKPHSFYFFHSSSILHSTGMQGCFFKPCTMVYCPNKRILLYALRQKHVHAKGQ